MSKGEVFTEEDAENDGLIKKEVGKVMVQNAKTHMPEMFKNFKQVCENKGMEPEELMGHHALTSLRSESHSTMLSEVKVDMGRLNSDEISVQDAKFIQKLTEELGMEESDSKDPIDRLIENRLEAKTGPILPGVDAADTESAEGEIAQRLDSIQKEVNRLKQEAEVPEADKGRESETNGKDEDGGSKKKDIDDLFEEEEGGGEPEDVEEDIDLGDGSIEVGDNAITNEGTDNEEDGGEVMDSSEGGEEE